PSTPPAPPPVEPPLVSPAEPPPPPDLPSPRRERAVTLALRYRRATDLDAGTLELAVRRPLASRAWADAAIGLQLGDADGTRAVTLTNPRLGLGLLVRPRLIATIDLDLPAASASGDAGEVAAASTDLAVVDPIPTAPRTTSVVVAVSPRRTVGKASAQLRLAASLLLPTDGPNRLLLHADLGGSIAVAGPVRLAATVETTSYILADVPGDDFVHRVAIACQLWSRAGELTAGVAAPLDRPQRDRDLVELTLAARARF
ncbi:MAG TPA: hypothetical protein VHE35_18100, partial [Kofleriaceae bacterium]|nr:hypothetical protein [Kofleriaceae bacterium]